MLQSLSMRAPVHRNLDLEPRLLGLAFPGQVLVVLLAFWPAALLLRPVLAIAAVGAVYLSIRLATAGKPAGYFAHSCAFRLRQWKCRGRFSAYRG